MKSIILALTLLGIGSTQAHASDIDVKACKKAFGVLQNKKITKLLRPRVVAVETSQDLSKLRQVEALAVADYKKYILEEMAEWGYEITTTQYRSRALDETVGYKVEVNGGDEAIGDFYYEFKPGIEDNDYNLLYYVWHNQTPVRAWICQRY